MFVRPYSVQHKFPLWATYFRQVLPHVHGFPMLRVLCLIRHPGCIRFPFSEYLPEPYDMRPGASGASRVLNISLPVYHGLRTPVDLHILANNGCSCIAFGER